MTAPEADPVQGASAPQSEAEVQNVAPGVKSPTGAPDAKTTFSSLSELKELDPKVYQATLKAIAQTIVNTMRRHQERLKRLIQQARRQ